MVVFVKIARQELNTFEVAFLALHFGAAPAVGAPGPSWLGHQSQKTASSGLGFGALCSFFGAAKGLTIADLSLISKIQPVLVAVLAPLLRWWLGSGALAVGCNGCCPSWLCAALGALLAGGRFVWVDGCLCRDLFSRCSHLSAIAKAGESHCGGGMVSGGHSHSGSIGLCIFARNHPATPEVTCGVPCWRSACLLAWGSC